MFHNITHLNIVDLHKQGFLKKGSLIKFRLNNIAIFDYGLDANDNEWTVGILSHIITAGPVKKECIVDMSEKDPFEVLFYDFYVYSDIGKERISLEGNDIMIYIPPKV